MFYDALSTKREKLKGSQAFPNHTNDIYLIMIHIQYILSIIYIAQITSSGSFDAVVSAVTSWFAKSEGHTNGVASTNGSHERNRTTADPEKRGFMRPPADYLRADSSAIESLGECWHKI